MPKAPTVRTLFIERMKRDGKHAEWKRRYAEAKKDLTWKEASDKVMAEMGFVSAIVEREIHERFLKYGNSGIPEALEAVKQEKLQEDIIEIFGDIRIEDEELPDDVAFVFHNLHRAKGEIEQWKVQPGDAPSSGAWNMLVWASSNMTKFMDKVLSEQLKTGREKEDQGMFDSGESIETIKKLLAGL